MQGGAADAEGPGGGGHVAARAGQRPPDHAAFGLDQFGLSAVGGQGQDVDGGELGGDPRVVDAQGYTGGAGGADDEVVAVYGDQRRRAPLRVAGEDDAGLGEGLAKGLRLDRASRVGDGGRR